MSALSGWWGVLFWGTVVTLKVFGVALLLTVAFGLLGATAKLSKNRIAVALANFYTVVFRGTPELLVLLIVYYGSAVTLTSIAQSINPAVKFLDIPPFWAGALGISLVVGSYVTETVRGAFLVVDPGHVEAARALGLSNLQTFIHIRIPQMWRLALPAFGNNMFSVVKDTALVSLLGLEEVVFAADVARSVTLKPFATYSVVAMIYLAITTVLTLSVMALEKYANRHLEGAR